MDRILFFALSACTLIGCGGGTATEGEDVFPVTGTVTLFGSPLADATVAFAPQGSQPTAIGKTDAAGQFQLTTYKFGDGAAEGAYKVVITKSAPVPPSGNDDAGHGPDYVDSGTSHAPGGAAAADTAELVPEQYSRSAETPLSATVKSDGDNTFTFAIE